MARRYRIALFLRCAVFATVTSLSAGAFVSAAGIVDGDQFRPADWPDAQGSDFDCWDLGLADSAEPPAPEACAEAMLPGWDDLPADGAFPADAAIFPDERP